MLCVLSRLGSPLARIAISDCFWFTVHRFTWCARDCVWVLQTEQSVGNQPLAYRDRRLERIVQIFQQCHQREHPNKTS
ncbi:hypothetical protein ACA910_005602 [Epithemia clementina (nom. ined.)]